MHSLLHAYQILTCGCICETNASAFTAIGCLHTAQGKNCSCMQGRCQGPSEYGLMYIGIHFYVICCEVTGPRRPQKLSLLSVLLNCNHVHSIALKFRHVFLHALALTSVDLVWKNAGHCTCERAVKLAIEYAMIVQSTLTPWNQHLGGLGSCDRCGLLLRQLHDWKAFS